MRIEFFHKGLVLIIVPLLVQLATMAILCWRYLEDTRGEKQATAKVAAAHKIEALSDSLASIIEKQPIGFMPAGRELLKSLQDTVSQAGLQANFDETDFKLALNDLNDIEALSAKEQASVADSYRPHLLAFCKDQSTRAAQIIAMHERRADDVWFFALMAAGFGINAGITIWLVTVINVAAAKRLNIIQDNTERLQHGMTLHTLFSGTDGFAKLDRRFHDMADALDKAQDRLRKGEARFRLVLENMPVGVVVATVDGVIESANPKGCQILGGDGHRLKGKPVIDFFKLVDAQSLAQSANQAQSISHSPSDVGKSDRTITTTATRYDGSQFSAEINISTYKDDAGDKLLISFEDISWRIELERMKREFMAMISHDIRTPLTSISSTLGMLAAGAYGDLPPKAMQRIEQDEDSLEHLMRLLNDLLSIEKLSASTFSLTRSDTSTTKIIERALAVVTSAAEGRGVAIEVGGDACPLQADEDRMVQVITNLLTNAIKFSPKSGKVTVEVDAPNDSSVRFRVSDEGCGIPAADQSKIFDSFGQVKSRDFAGAKGVGLGLAICKQIVDQHDGQIGVVSSEGKGTTFWLIIPHAAGTPREALHAALEVSE